MRAQDLVRVMAEHGVGLTPFVNPVVPLALTTYPPGLSRGSAQSSGVATGQALVTAFPFVRGRSFRSHSPEVRGRSVASAANQIRAPCAPSNARKLGGPIMLQTPIQPAKRASGSPRIQAQLQDCGPLLDGSQSRAPSPCRSRRLGRGCNPQFHELRRLGLPHPLLPFVELPCPQPTPLAKRRHAQAALTLFRNQLTPLRQRLRLRWSHATTVLYPAAPKQAVLYTALTRYPSERHKNRIQFTEHLVDCTTLTEFI
jgi:hypothetical protein